MYLDIGDAVAAGALRAGIERPANTAQVLLLLYEGDKHGAAHAAFGSAGSAAGPYENWGVYEALRDWAMDTGEYSKAREHIELLAGPTAKDFAFEAKNFRAVPVLAQIEMAAGETDAARELLERCIRWIEEVHLSELGDVYALRIKANAQLMLGQTDEALATLRDSFRASDYLQWWYTIERDSLWLPLHDDPRFRQIADDVRRHVAEQQARLEDLRRQALVPRRTLAASVSANVQGN
jgi:tetratricopeptide (TPR) repeat protein